MRKRRFARDRILAARDQVVIALAVSRGGDELGQHVVAVGLELAKGDGLFHHAHAPAEVVLDRAGEGFFEAQGTVERLHGGLNLLQVGVAGLDHGVRGDRLRLD